jgi:hypothetical protein
LPENLLARVYLWTILVALVCGLVFWFAISFDFGLGLFVTAVWAVAGFRALEGLLRSAILPPGVPRNIFAIILWLMAKLAVYAMAVWVLFSRPFPAISHAVGFTLMLVVLVALGAQARSSEIRQTTSRGDDA